MYTFGQLVVIYFIIAEIILVALFVLLCYLAKIYFKFKAYVEKKIITKIRHDTIHNQQLTAYYIKKVDLVIVAFRGIDNYDAVKKKIIRDQVLPYAINFAAQKDWLKRYLLLECLRYRVDDFNNDEIKLLIKLIQDKVAMVNLNAIDVGMQSSDKQVMRVIIDEMREQNHSFHALIISNMRNSDVMIQVIQEVLQKSDDNQIKKICYDILSKKNAPPEVFTCAKKDITNSSSSLNLRIAAIHVLPKADKKAAFDLLDPLSRHENWLIRNAAVQSLGETQDKRSLKSLEKSLDDSEWWVRTSAAKALLNFGDEGQEIIKKYKRSENTHYHETAEYYLKIETMENKGSAQRG